MAIAITHTAKSFDKTNFAFRENAGKRVLAGGGVLLSVSHCLFAILRKRRLAPITEKKQMNAIVTIKLKTEPLPTKSGRFKSVYEMRTEFIYLRSNVPLINLSVT
jgi:hypothetical protein